VNPKAKAIRLTLCAVVGILVWVLVGWPTSDALAIRRQLSTALAQARTVRLEESAGLNILTVVELPRSEWHKLLDALPPVPDAGVRILIRKCYWPNHRALIVGEHGEEFTLDVSFVCEEISTEASGVHGTPYFWRSSIRKMFLEFHVPIRDPSEYSKLNRLSAI